MNRFIHDIELYFSVEPPLLPDEQHHPFHIEMLEAHPEFSKEAGGFSGVARIGCWHMQGHENATRPKLLKSAESRPNTATTDKLLWQLLHGSCGAITRAVSPWLGVVDPEIRDDYRNVTQNTCPSVQMDTTLDEVFTTRGFY